MKETIEYYTIMWYEGQSYKKNHKKGKINIHRMTICEVGLNFNSKVLRQPPKINNEVFLEIYKLDKKVIFKLVLGMLGLLGLALKQI